MTRFGNTNRLVRNSRWDIGLSKTGYNSEAGRCLAMQATLAGRSVIIVLLDSWGKYTRVADANRIRQWLEFAFGRSAGPHRATSSPVVKRGSDSFISAPAWTDWPA